jgi:hypothetical protein
MAKKKQAAPRTRRAATVRPPDAAGPELIVILASDEAEETPPPVARRARSGASRGAGLARVMRRAGATLQPLFGVTAERVVAERDAASRRAGATLPHLERFYRVEAPRGALAALARELNEQPEVAAAYVKPPTTPPVLNTMRAGATLPPALTPSFVSRQGYLDPAPAGIDARFAWTLPGGRGEGVRVIDIEGGWRLSHEDLLQNQGGLAGGTMIDDVGWRNHGTAVMGEIGADDTAFGITGISPAANLKAVSHGGIGSAAAIRLAASMLQAGDILLLEMHRPGPRFNFQTRADQRGFIAVEWWPDDYEAIRFAVARGILVVEAAGNGAESLDDAIYDSPQLGFPSSWRNPFRRGQRDSGALIVGAGAPPPGTHGRSHGPDRSRLDFSNFGECVDTQAWGREVTSTGYGDLQGGPQEDIWYTDQFSGTSSASPIVVGALACVQGILRARNKPLLTPAAARHLLRSTGSPQQAGPNGTGRIGSRPDLRQLIQQVAAEETTGGLNRPVVQVVSYDPKMRRAATWRAVIDDVANPEHRVIIEIARGNLNVTWQNPKGENRKERAGYIDIN